MEHGPQRWREVTVAVLGVARILIAQEADLMELNRWIGAMVVGQLEEHKSRCLAACTCASHQYAMNLDPFLHVREMDHQFCQGGYPSET